MDNEKKDHSETKVIRWVEHKEEKTYCERRSVRAYRDPTADMAIGNIMREERRKKKLENKLNNRNGSVDTKPIDIKFAGTKSAGTKSVAIKSGGINDEGK